MKLIYIPEQNWRLFQYPEYAEMLRAWQAMAETISLIKDNFIIVYYLIVASHSPVSSGIYPIA